MTLSNSTSITGCTRSVTGLRMRVKTWREQGLKVAFVPTMGALHEGHLSLITLAGEVADRVVASIFVNPKQFAAHEDLGTYPRQEKRDIELLEAAGCHLVYIPTPDEMYPEGYSTSVKVESVSDGLCGSSRPHFFGGVATVVCKLLNQCQPDMGVFGEKDFQQLLVLRRMVRDLDMPIEIIGAPIVRESDGLAMSSRNAYLSPEDRARAGHLNEIMTQAARGLREGDTVGEALSRARKHLKKSGFTEIDYFELRRESDLTPITRGQLDIEKIETARLFAAVVLGSTRLIDNRPVRRVLKD